MTAPNESQNEVTFLRNQLLVGVHERPFLADVALSVKGANSPAVIFSHGFKGFKDWGPFDLIAKKFALQGFHFIKYNFAFNGTTIDSPYDFSDLEAFGNNNFTHELDDLDRMISFVSDDLDLVTPTSIFLLGHSRGGGISMLKAGEDPRVDCVVTWGSVASFTRYISLAEIRNWKQDGVIYVENARTGQSMPLYIQLYDDFIKNRSRLDIENCIASLSTPVLLIHGTHDETVPISHARELITHGKSIQLLEIQQGDHTFGGEHPMTSSDLPIQLADVIQHTISYYQQI
jgi:pimeloyl-ACP methyl ester carboxylesterase